MTQSISPAKTAELVKLMTKKLSEDRTTTPDRRALARASKRLGLAALRVRTRLSQWLDS